MSAPLPAFDADRAVTAFPDWLSSRPSAQVEAIRNQLAIAPDKEREKRILSSQFWLSEHSGLPLRNVIQNWQPLRDGYSVRLGFGDAGLTDDGFAGEVQKLAQGRIDENLMLNGKDGKDADSIASRQASMAQRAYWSAAEGLKPDKMADMAAGYQAWTASNPKGFNPKNAHKYWKSWVDIYNRGRDDATVAHQAAQAIIPLLQTSGAGGVPEFEKVLDIAGNLTPQQQLLLMQGMKGEAGQLMQPQKVGTENGSTVYGQSPMDELGTAKTAAFASWRMLDDMLTDAGAIQGEAALKNIKFTAGQEVRVDELKQGIPAVVKGVKQRWVANLNTGASTGGLANLFMGGPDTVKLTEEQAKQANDLVAAQLKGRVLARQLKQFAQGDLATLKADNMFSASVIGAAQSLPVMGAVMVPGNIGTVTVLAPYYTRNAELDMIENGVPADKAALYAPISGAAQAFQDKFQAEVLFARFPGFSFLKNWAVGSVTKAALRAAGTAAIEVGTEVLQDPITTAATQQLASALHSDVPGPDWDKVMGEAWAQTPENLLAMLPWVMLGTGAAHIKDYADANAMAQDPEAMKALGFTPSMIAAVELAPDNEKAATFQAVFKDRVPVLAKPASGAEPVITSPVLDTQAAEQELNAQAGVKSIRRDDNGWHLVMQDGTSVPTGTVEAALHMRESLIRASTEEEAAAMVKVADEIQASFASEGKTSSQTFTSKRVEISPEGATATSLSGKVEPHQFNTPGAAAELQRELAALGAGPSQLIQGSNWIAEDGTRMLESHQTTQKGFTQIHEFVESRFRPILSQDFKRVNAAARVLTDTGLFDPERQTNPEDRNFAQRMQNVADGVATEAEARETMVEAIVSNWLSKRKDGSNFAAGSISAIANGAVQSNISKADRQALGWLRSMLKAVRAYLRGIFSVAAKIQKARRDGKLKPGDAFDSLVNDIFGTTEQQKHNEAVAKEAGATQPESFSLASSGTLDALAAQFENTSLPPEKRLRIHENAAETLRGMARAIRFNDAENGPATMAGIEKQRSAMQRTREEQLLQEIEKDFGDISGAEFMAKATNQPVIDAIMKQQPGDKFPRSMIRSMSAAKAAGMTVKGEYDGSNELPRWIFGGTLAPDKMASSLYNDGFIAEDSTEAMWTAISAALKSTGIAKDRLSAYAQRKAEARQQARDEASAWAEKQTAALPTDKATAGRKEMLRSLQVLDAMLVQLPQEIRAKVGGFTKLAALTTDAARAKFLSKRVKKMGEVLEDFLKEEYTDKLTDLIDKGQPDGKPGEKAKGRIGAEAHRFFAAVKEAAALSEKEVEAKQLELEAALTADDITDAKAADIFERQQILDTFGAMAKKNAAELAKAFEMAQEVYDTGRNKWRVQEEQRLEEVKGYAGQVEAALGSGAYSKTQAKKNVARRLKEKISGAGLELKNFAGFMRSVLGDAHPIAKRWGDKARTGYAMTEDFRRGLRKEWEAAITKATGEKGRAARIAVWDMADKQSITVTLEGEARTSTEAVPVSVIEDIMDGKVKPADVGLTQEEVDALLSLAPGEPLEVKRTTRGPVDEAKITEAEGVFITMLAGQEQYAAGLDAAGFTKAVVQQIEDALSDGAKTLRQFMAEKYAQGYTDLNRVFRRMFGVDLAQIENYAPAAFYHTGDERVKGPDETLSDGGFRAGFLKTRKRHTAAPRLENAFATFFGHQAQSAHWQAFAELVREMRGVMGRPEVKRAFEAAHGKEGLGLMNDWVRALEGNGIQKAHGIWDGITRWLLKQAAYIHLAWKFGTLAVQSTAALGALYKIPVGAYAKGMGRLLSGKLRWKEMWNSPLIRNRLENGYAPEVRAALNDMWSAKPSMRQDFLEKGMDLIGWVDAVFTTASASIAWDYHYTEARKAGMNEEGARAIADTTTAEIVSETAQPATVADKSLFEAKQGNLAKLAFMYASEGRQKAALLIEAWKKTLTGKATRDDIRVLMVSHLIVGPLIQAIRNAWWDARDDDDDTVFDEKHWKGIEWLKAIGMGPLNGIPLLNDVVSSFDSSNAAVGRFGDAFKAAGEAYKGPAKGNSEKGEFYWNRSVKILQGLDAFTATVAGIADQVFKVADNLDGKDTGKSQRKAQTPEGESAR